jgi:chaperone required for assembly of F1-ATPase
MESQIDQLYDTLLRVETEEDNKPLLDWLENVCQKQFGLVDGLVANFIMNIDQPVFAKKLLKVLR